MIAGSYKPKRTGYIRTPEIQTLGVSYPHELMNILLLELKPGYEQWAIQKIRKLLERNADEIKYIRTSYRESKAKNLSSNKVSAHEELRETENNDSSQMPLKFATTFGHFSLASFFLSSGFGLSPLRSSLLTPDT